MRRRRRVALAPPSPMAAASAEVALSGARYRIRTLLAGPFTDPALRAHCDQTAAALRAGFERYGIDLADDVRHALLVAADSMLTSHSNLAGVDPCITTTRMWAITAELAGALLAIDDHEQGAHA